MTMSTQVSFIPTFLWEAGNLNKYKCTILQQYMYSMTQALIQNTLHWLRLTEVSHTYYKWL